MLNIVKLPILLSFFSIIASLRANIAAASSSSDISNELELPQRADDGYVWDLLWVLLALAVVILLLYFTVKFLANKNKAFLSPKGIQSLGGIGLGANSSVQVLSIANKVYIVGVGQQVTLLDKETDPEVVADIIESFSTQNQANFASFKDWITAIKRKKESDELNVQDVQWNQTNKNAFESLLQSKLDKQAERKQQLESLLKDNNE